MTKWSDLEAEPINSWVELAERLELYGRAVSALGGMNDLDRALHMAADGIALLIESVPGCDFTSGTYEQWKRKQDAFKRRGALYAVGSKSDG